MAKDIVSNPLPICRCCGQPLQADRQADGKGSHYTIVTCFNPLCELRYVTRELNGYLKLLVGLSDTSLTEGHLEAVFSKCQTPDILEQWANVDQWRDGC